MKSHCKASHTGILTLTAIMTLVAGLPHFNCRCPNGDVKPYCLGTVFSSAGCCCGNAHGASQTSETNCCVSSDECCGESDHPGNDGRQASSTCCTKTLAEPAIGIVTTGQPALDHDAPSFVAVDASFSQWLHSPTIARVAWHVHLVAPPTDRVIAFQHFLI